MTGRAFVHPRPTDRVGEGGDESFTWVDVGTLKANGISDLFVYAGAAMPPLVYLQGVLQSGISVTFIDEGSNAPYLTGDPRAAGVARVLAVESKLAAIYPPACSIVYVISDQDSGTPGRNDPRVIAHAAGIDSTSSRPGWVGYTNRNGVDAARPVAPHMRASWVPRTWGANVTDAIVQEIGSPVDGLDLDGIQIAEWGQWRLGTPEVDVSAEHAPILVQDKASPGTPAYVIGWVPQLLGCYRRAVSTAEAFGGELGAEEFDGFIETDPANAGQPYNVPTATINLFPLLPSDAAPPVDVNALATALAAKLPPNTAIDPAALAAGVASHLALTTK